MRFMKSVRWFGRAAAWIACAGVPLAACGPTSESDEHLGVANAELNGRDTSTSEAVQNPNRQLAGWDAATIGDTVQVSPDGAFAMSTPSKGSNHWKFYTVKPLDTGVSIDANSDETTGFDLDLILAPSNKDVTGSPADPATCQSVGALSALTFDPDFGNAAIRIAGTTAAEAKTNCFAANPAFTANGTYTCRKMLVYAEVNCGTALRVAVAPLSVASVETTGTIVGVKLGNFVSVKDEVGADILINANFDNEFVEHMTATADGRLVVYWNFGEGMRYTYSEHPATGMGFTAPKNLWEMAANEANTLITRGGKTYTFADLYPIAKYPVRFPNGTLVQTPGNTMGCGYPWITPDGTDIFCDAGKLSVLVTFGKSTRGTIKHIDGQVQVTQGRYCDEEITGIQEDDTPITESCAIPRAACSNRQETLACLHNLGIQNMTSLGTPTGFWQHATSPTISAPRMPLNRRSHMRSMVAMNSAMRYFKIDSNTSADDFIYFEVANDDFNDPAFDAFFHMNEAIMPNANNQIEKYDPFRRTLWPTAESPMTADTSGHGFMMRLVDGAQFPFEYNGKVETPGTPNPGFLGRAIHFNSTSKAEFVSVNTTVPKHSRMTLEFAVQPTTLLYNPTQGLGTTLINAPGSFSVGIGQNGKLRFTANNQSASWTVNLMNNVWTHFALTYEVLPGTGKSARLRLYKDGTFVTEKTVTSSVAADIPAINLASTSAPICMGPACITGGLSSADYWLDEVAMSNVVRDDAYIAAAAFAKHDVSTVDVARSIAEFPGLLANGIPPGLSANDLRIPTDILNLFQTPADVPGKKAKFAAITALGKSLFESDILTTHKVGTSLVKHAGRSCQSCHDEGHGFASPQPFDPTLTGGLLDRNSPTIVNRVFSIQQFIDRRAPDLLTQVLMPVENQSEMGGVVNDVLAEINGGAEHAQGQTYLAWFQSAFGITGNIGREHLAQALTVYVLSLVKGDSNADKIRTTGTASPLSPEEIDVATVAKGMQLFNGKARCSACHKGPNFSDELMHASGPSGLPTKTPTLRGIRNSGPFFVRKGPHFDDGASLPTTLKQVVDFYNDGGCGAATCDPELMPLGLEPDEVAQLVAFLNAL